MNDFEHPARLARRAGLLLAAAACAGWPGLLAAQPARKARIGLLVPVQAQSRVPELLERLRQLGWTPGDNLEVEQRIPETPQALDSSVAELVALKVDVIIALLTPAVMAARRATASVPIVMAGAAVDPVAGGLAKSLAQPGGNVTGFVVPGALLASKSFELMRELRGQTRRFGVLANGADPFTPALVKTLNDAAQVLGIRLGTTTVRSPDEYAKAFSAWEASRVDAVFVQPSLDTGQAAALALSHRLPSFSFVRGYARAGGLLSYAANPGEVSRRSADYTDRILRGADPARTPIEQASSYELTLNLRTAKALGVSVPNLLMMRATEVIE